MIRLLILPHLIALAAVTGNIIANALIAAWLPRISLVFYGDVTPGAVASLLWLAAARLTPVWDTSYTVAGLILFCLFSAWSIGKPGNAIRFGAAAGVAGGLLFLLNSSSIMVSLPWIAFLIARRRIPLRKAAMYGGVLLTSLLIIVSAWALRNRHQLGAPVLRTNLGMTLYASNNDCAQSSMIETERHGCYQAHHPNTSMSEARLLRTLGEVEYDRRRTADAESWALANPARFWRLTAERLWEFWFPRPEQYPYTTYVIWLATALAIPGLALMIYDRKAVTVFVVAVHLIYPLMYYVVVTNVRYRYPMLWLSLLPAGYFISTINRTWHGRATKM